MSRAFRCEDALSPVLPAEVRSAVLRSLWQGQHRREALWRWVMMGPTGNWVGWAASEVLWIEPFSVGLPPNGA